MSEAAPKIELKAHASPASISAGPPPTQAAFDKVREALGVAAYSEHGQIARVITQATRKFKLSGGKEGGIKKREKIMLAVGAVLVAGYLIAKFSGTSNDPAAVTGTTALKLDDPVHKQAIEQAKKELNTQDMSPEVYKRAVEIVKQH